MGIKGLLKALSSVQETGDLSEFSGATVAVDASTWLHRFAYSCAPALVLGQPTTKHLDSCVNFAKALRDGMGVYLVFVFDGSPLPAKEGTRQKRQMLREAARTKALQLFKCPKRSREAFRYFQQAIEITPQMAHQLFVELQRHGFECLVAPFEADAELGYLCEIGYAAATISVDSDLALHGCGIVLYSVETNGLCRILRKSAIKESGMFEKASFSDDNLLMCCILAGCDYVPNLRGIGIHKAAKIVSRSGSDISEVLSVITGELQNKKLKCEVPAADYGKQLQRAVFAFKYQWVFDPRNGGKLLRKQEIPADVDNELLNQAVGVIQDIDLVKRACMGELNPATLEPFASSSLPDENTNPLSENMGTNGGAATAREERGSRLSYSGATRSRKSETKRYPWITYKPPRKTNVKLNSGCLSSTESIRKFLPQGRGAGPVTEQSFYRPTAEPPNASSKRRARETNTDPFNNTVAVLSNGEDISAFAISKHDTTAGEASRPSENRSTICGAVAPLRSPLSEADSICGNRIIHGSTPDHGNFNNSSPLAKRSKHDPARFASPPLPSARCSVVTEPTPLFVEQAVLGAATPDTYQLDLVCFTQEGKLRQFAGTTDENQLPAASKMKGIGRCRLPETSIFDAVEILAREKLSEPIPATGAAAPDPGGKASSKLLGLEAFRFTCDEDAVHQPKANSSAETSCDNGSRGRFMRRSFVMPRRVKIPK